MKPLSPELTAALLAMAKAARRQVQISRAIPEADVEIELRVTVYCDGKAYGRAFGAGGGKNADQISLTPGSSK